MSSPVDSAIIEVTKARVIVSRLRTPQVRGADELGVLSATAWAWFKSHRPSIEASCPNADFASVDAPYRSILDATNRASSKRTYLSSLKTVKDALIELRAALLVLPTATAVSNDAPPDFAPLVGNLAMRDILTRRWQECQKCVNAQAHLAAIVMMGGLLEALFVARANKMVDKSALINSTSAPKDKNTGKTVNYQEWMLDSYIKVGHELNWITDSAKQLATVLKEYRNYVHPEKELRHQVELAQNDSSIFWQVTKALVRQLLLSATP